MTTFAKVLVEVLDLQREVRIVDAARVAYAECPVELRQAHLERPRHARAGVGEEDVGVRPARGCGAIGRGVAHEAEGAHHVGVAGVRGAGAERQDQKRSQNGF